MRKIPSIFVRDWAGDRSRVTSEPNPEADWVFGGEGLATRKWDGSAVLVDGGLLYCRYDAKKGRRPPSGFSPAQPEPDKETGHWPGWVPAREDQHKWQLAAFRSAPYADGTYEACGPHFQSNPECFGADVLVPHGGERYDNGVPTDFDGLKSWLAERDIEGLVWRHPDGRMAKIKKSDFGLPRKPEVPAAADERGKVNESQIGSSPNSLGRVLEIKTEGSAHFPRTA